MSHPTQRERLTRLEQVKKWLQDSPSNMGYVVTQTMGKYGCTRRKAIEYIAEVARE